MESFVKDWFVELVYTRLPLHRGFEVSPEIGAGIFRELQKQGFQKWQIPSAETCILKTDWQFKKKNLTVNDFYPTKEQLSGYDIFILLEEHLAIIQSKEKELTQIWQAYRDQSVHDAVKGEYMHLQKNARMHYEYIVDLKTENSELKQKIEKLNSKITQYRGKYDQN